VIPDGAVEVTRLFTESQNARDVQTLHDLVTDDVEFRNRAGETLHGHAGLEDLVRAAADTDILLAREGAETVEIGSGPGAQHVTVAVRCVVRKSELKGVAHFDVLGDRVKAFEVIPAP
jgi:hypothetical protein